MRGLDSEGHVANFVETEQIVQYNGGRASFVQVRCLWGNCTPNQKLAGFVLYLKMIKTFLKNNMCILQEICPRISKIALKLK